jgi:ligand-binding SRPBCC domain-containing protein
LRTFKNTFLVNNNINKVWEFYTDINHLKIITPKEINLQVINATDQKFSQGTEIWIKGKIFVSKIREWHSIITFLKPYEYVDEMISGPFKKWRHLHKFYDLDHGQKTEVVDQVDFELPYGILGKLFEEYAYNQLRKIFDHRKIATIKNLETPSV